MKLSGRTLATALFFAALAAGSTGCASYNYVAQKDSAYIRGTDNQTLLTPETSFVGILDIDGQYVGMGWNFNSGKYVAPGKHTILLMFNPSVDNYTSMQDPVDVDLVANHTYQFSIAKDSVDITLLDETNGPAKPVGAGEWSFGGVQFQDLDPIGDNNFTGAILVAPPLNSGHKSGPPSIPHAPRPKPAGGGHGGGKHTGGGKKK